MTRCSQRGAPRSKFFYLNRWSGAKYYILEEKLGSNFGLPSALTVKRYASADSRSTFGRRSTDVQTTFDQPSPDCWCGPTVRSADASADKPAKLQTWQTTLDKPAKLHLIPRQHVPATPTVSTVRWFLSRYGNPYLSIKVLPALAECWEDIAKRTHKEWD